MLGSNTLKNLPQLTTLLVGFSLAIVCGQSEAGPILNGRFETGNFSNWTVTSEPVALASEFAAVVNNTYPLAPLQGTYSALLVSRGQQPIFPAAPPGSYNTCAGDAWDVNCPPPTSFTNTPPGGPAVTYPMGPLSYTAYTSIAQDFDALAGDVIALDWQYLTNDSCGDDGTVVLTNGITRLVTNYYPRGDCVANPPPPSFGAAPPGTGFNFALPPETEFISLPTSGVWTMYVTVGQVADVYVSSGLLVDDVRQLRELPEPATLALVAIALSGLALSRRRAI